MNPFSTLYCRVFQRIMYVAAAAIPFRLPEVIEGADALAQKIYDLGFRKPLLVTDRSLHTLGMEKKFIEAFEKAGMRSGLFYGVDPNPTFGMVQNGYAVYKQENCDCLVALGGGSSMDAAKVIAIRIAYPDKDLASFKGLLKVHRELVPLFAIPTTAGTGSEATLAAVIVNEFTRDKFQIDDAKLIPYGAVFDPTLLTNLPPRVIAATGMDALTHAVESFIGQSNYKRTKADALEAIELIDRHLLAFYKNPLDLVEARFMQKAAFLAGAAFTRSYVGYVHALAHSLGGMYNVPHGYANAVLLPHVLLAYGKKAHKKLAYLCDLLALAPNAVTRQEKAHAFIKHVVDMNKAMGIPEAFEGLVKEEDIRALAVHAAKEGNPLYPVPKTMNAKELEMVLRSALK